MGWAVGYDTTWHRDVGYGVAATCDHPGCGAEIDRGLSYVCGGQPFGGDRGCGLYFCADHRQYLEEAEAEVCHQCFNDEDPYEPTPDTREWIEHKLGDPSWAPWRAEHTDDVARMWLAVA